jgi:hypothetical protein
MLVQERNTHTSPNCELLSDVLSLEARAGGESAVLQRLKSDAPMRAQSQLKVWRADNSLLWADEAPQLAKSSHLRTDRFEIEAPGLPGGALQAAYTVDFSRDAAIGRRWGWLLVLATLAAGALVRWVHACARQLTCDLAAQTRAMAPGKLLSVEAGRPGRRTSALDRTVQRTDGPA